MRHRLLPLASAVGVTLSLAACGSGNGEAADASTLVIYSGRQEKLVQPIIDRFSEQTGTDVSVRYGNTAQLAAQIMEEGDRTKADVFFAQDGGALGALTKAGRLAELPQQTLDTVEPRYRAADGTWVGVSGRARVIVYDPAEVVEADVPDSVYDLSDSRWKGKVGIAPSNASFEAFVTAMRVLDGDEKARAWLEGMAANDVQTFDNNVALLNAAEDGVVALGLINHYYWYEQVAEEGVEAVPARLKFLANGDPGGLVNVAGVGILEQTDRSVEARRFVDFLLSETAQSYFADETMEYPLRPGVATAPDLPSLDSLQAPDIDLSDLDSLEVTLQMIEETGLT